MKMMMNHPIYLEDIKTITSSSFISWDRLKDKSMFISGATGMIGSCLVDSIMFMNKEYGLHCKVYVLTRSAARAAERFANWADNTCLHFVEGDVNDPITFDEVTKCDYVLHLASNTHPVAYATDPIGTVTTNIIGTRNMLDLAVKTNADRFVFASSNEIYGENKGDTELFNESYLGYIDCNTLRAGYPESKRCGETLCQAYGKQKGLDFVIARFTRSFGPTLLNSDTKAMSQFLRKGVAKEDIVLKSKGNQLYSYTYTADAVTGLLTVLLKGESGEAYNISEESEDIPLKEIASRIAEFAGTKVVFDLPDEVEAAGFSKATKARLDGSKIRSLGWKAQFPMDKAIKRTMEVLESVN